MKTIKVGLNGFGRIGRAFTRIALTRNNFEIVAINTRTGTPQMMAYLLQHDSVYRKFQKKIDFDDNSIKIENQTIKTINFSDPGQIPWDEYGVDLVIDATGAFGTREDLSKHIRGSVKKVVLTAPAKDESIPHLVLGVNDDKIDFNSESIISNASCTTNCASPMFKVIDDNFKIISGFLTSAHSYTLTQSLLDDPGRDIERSRPAPLNLVPSTTGAAKAVVKTLPQLAGKIDGMAIRVPVPTVSFTDISAIVEKSTTIDEVNQVFQNASQQSMKNILSYADEVLVSSDYIGSPFSCIFDPHYTKVINGNFVKIFGWYDNEWGYSTRLVDVIEKLSDII